MSTFQVPHPNDPSLQQVFQNSCAVISGAGQSVPFCEMMCNVLYPNGLARGTGATPQVPCSVVCQQQCPDYMKGFYATAYGTDQAAGCFQTPIGSNCEQIGGPQSAMIYAMTATPATFATPPSWSANPALQKQWVQTQLNLFSPPPPPPPPGPPYPPPVGSVWN